MSHKNTLEVFESRYIPEPNSGCWIWTAYSPNGRYGSMLWHGPRVLAHVLSRRLYRGKVPRGKVLDHTCKNTFCVNPYHLEPIKQLENVRRGKLASSTVCSKGHLYSDGFEIYKRKDDVGIQYRRCLTCYRMKYPGTKKI